MVGLALGLMGWVPPAAAVIQVKVENLSYEPCPPEASANMVLGGGTLSANCFRVKGLAVNASGKTLYNADVFGRIYDADGNDAMPERGRLGSIDELPPGNTPFEITVSVPAEQAEPLQLKQFKATGFAGKVRR
ncbi:MAG: hypothetical protein HC918_14325 [Oscillatoriales cyanobacterium SM2_1_8]|nr:hypothetical protein [Oscillatoriales cyanobacterium SM2_1_8]